MDTTDMKREKRSLYTRESMTTNTVIGRFQVAYQIVYAKKFIIAERNVQYLIYHRSERYRYRILDLNIELLWVNYLGNVYNHNR